MTDHSHPLKSKCYLRKNSEDILGIAEPIISVLDFESRKRCEIVPHTGGRTGECRNLAEDRIRVRNVDLLHAVIRLPEFPEPRQAICRLHVPSLTVGGWTAKERMVRDVCEFGD